MESYKLIKANGDELEFDIGKYFLKSTGAFGNPPIQYSTQKTFFQDGEIINNFTAAPRQFNLMLYAKPFNYEVDRTSYWDLRLGILRFLSPQNGAMTFQFTRDDHTIFELTNVYPTDGLTLGGETYNEERNDGTIDEQIALTAFDPIWRKSPIVNTGTLTPTADENLVFPITFPISFGSSGVFINNEINYEGTWKSYPKITINGPYTTCTITNVATGAVIRLIEPILSTNTRIIDLTDPVNGFTIVDEYGNNKFNEVNVGSNFTNFYLAPDEDNEIQFSFLGGNDTHTDASIQYYERYLGI